MNNDPTAPLNPAAPKDNKTLMLNVAAMVVTELIAQLPNLQGQLPADYYAFAFYALGAANIVVKLLRGKTITLRKVG